MAKTTVVWDGLEEYRAALAQLPEACLGEAEKLAEGEANAAYVTIAAVYEAHRFTGTLRKRLTLSPLTRKGGLVSGLVLTSGSPLAWLFDNGSQARHYVEASGVEHKTGAMWSKSPPTHIFTRTVGNARRRLVQLYAAMLLRHGAASVSGE